jgi:hypothetical protein
MSFLLAKKKFQAPSATSSIEKSRENEKFFPKKISA